MKTIVTAIALLAGMAPALAANYNRTLPPRYLYNRAPPLNNRALPPKRKPYLQMPAASPLSSNGIATPPGFSFGGGEARYSGGGGGYSASACVTSRGYCATNVSIGANCSCTDRAGNVYRGTGQ
jgi:hypothetical protein